MAETLDIRACALVLLRPLRKILDGDAAAIKEMKPAPRPLVPGEASETKARRRRLDESCLAAKAFKPTRCFSLRAIPVETVLTASYLLNCEDLFPD